MGKSHKSDKKEKKEKKKVVVESDPESSEEESPEVSSEEEQTPEVGSKRKFDGADDESTKKASRQGVTMFVGNLPWSTNEDAIREFFDGIEITNIRMMNDRNTGNFKGFCYVDFADQDNADKALELKGADYEGREINVDVTQDNGGGGARGGNDNSGGGGGEKSLTCYVGNLSYHVDENAVREFFAEAGGIESCRMITDYETGQSKGFCFVQFSDQDAADAAVSYHGSELDGRNLRITYDTNKPGGGRGGRGGGRGRGDRGGGRGRGFGGGRGGDRGGRGGRGGGRGFGGGRGGDRGGRGGRGGGRGRGNPAFAGKKISFD